MGPDPIRVLIVDDSALMRRLISDLIEAAPDFTVVGAARDGKEAIAMVEELSPNVVTMDVEMPVMDGLAALEQIMSRHPTPVVMLSSRTAHGADATLRSLELGAVDFVCKPSGSISLNIAEVRSLLLGKLRLAASAHLMPPRSPAAKPHAFGAPMPRAGNAPADRLVVIASSTGGPRALEAIIPELPADLSAAVAVAQHMPAGFTRAMADRFRSFSDIDVREAVDGDALLPGAALIAPGGRHMIIDHRRRVRITDDPPIWGVRPSADPLMTSAAEAYGSRCVGVILTGMGQDGVRGMTAIHRAGGITIAQDEATCVVYGMPRAAVEQGSVDLVAPLPDIARILCRALSSVAAGQQRRPPRYA